MAMEAGDARSGTGLAGAIAEAMRRAEPRFDVNAPNGDFLPNAIASAVVEYLRTEAEVRVTVIDRRGSPLGAGSGSLT